MQTNKRNTVRCPDECPTGSDQDALDGQSIADRAALRFDIRAALRGFVLAPFRIHHYRDVHSRMLSDALCTMDCGPRSNKKLPD